MCTIGIMLFVAGFLVMAITSFNFTTKKEVLDVGPIEVKKEEPHYIEWPVRVGDVFAVACAMLLVAGRENNHTSTGSDKSYFWRPQASCAGK